MSSTNLNYPQLLTVKDFCAKHPAFSEGGIRHLIFYSSDRYTAAGEEIPGNGLGQTGAIVRIGRRVLIDENQFFCWIKSQNCVSPSA